MSDPVTAIVTSKNSKYLYWAVGGSVAALVIFAIWKANQAADLVIAPVQAVETGTATAVSDTWSGLKSVVSSAESGIAGLWDKVTGQSQSTSTPANGG